MEGGGPRVDVITRKHLPASLTSPSTCHSRLGHLPSPPLLTAVLLNQLGSLELCGAPRVAAVSPDGRWVVVGTAEGKVHWGKREEGEREGWEYLGSPAMPALPL